MRPYSFKLHLIFPKFLASILFILLPFSNSFGESLSCPSERERNAVQEEYIKKRITHAWNIQTIVEPESAQKNPRPMPKLTLYNVAENSGAIFRNWQRRKGISATSLMFSFHTKDSAAPEVVRVNRKSIWCLARKGDVLLLSDGITHHYSMVYAINREENLVFLLDQWPDISFLRKNFNESGVQAEIIDWNELAFLLDHSPPIQGVVKKLIKLSADEFLDVALGLITLDAPEIQDHFFRIAPEQKTNPKVYLAFGMTFLNWTDNRFIVHAINSLRDALILQGSENNNDIVKLTRNRLDLALNVHYYNFIEKSNLAQAQQIKSEIDKLRQRYGKSSLLSAYAAVDYYRLGLASGYAQRLSDAISYFSKAISIKPDYEEAYLHRAAAEIKSDPQAVIDDTSKALELNAKAYQDLVSQKEKRLARDLMGGQIDLATEGRIRSNKILALKIRGETWAKLEYANSGSIHGLKYAEYAVHDGQHLIELDPESPDGYIIVGQAHFLRGLTEKKNGNFELSRRLLQSAKQYWLKVPRLIKDPDKKKVIMNRIEEIDGLLK